ncbi:uncharacterized protein LOC110456760 [Mizuhopecten yessoensis]|uniref:Uncharacterized protein n=1 Tax=Mizuhopecten yessoensis TaxID=6573 RepID=A0A210QA71_MIZYE|nr:uncharacterized protein LOC110456760 [Mizuhopecten yessoensis]OWF45627.1 hypothetical protein KP79_PYT05930 [Mizuhopecten yessoensis]
MAPEVRKCTPKPGLVILLVLGFIPGVLCDNYNLSGLVASSIAAVFYLILLTAVITMGIIWHRWYPRYQLAHNKVKIPRHVRFAQLHGSRVEIIEPESRSLHLTSYPPSMRSTKVMVPTATTYQKADSWIKEQRRFGGDQVPKESVMNFDEEEGDVIVTEVGPEVEIPKSRLNTTIQVDPDKNKNNATDDEISRLNRRQSDLTHSQGIAGVFSFDDEDTVLDSNVGNEGTVLY